MNDTEKNYTDGSVTKKGGFFAWLDNFWYHYKWHSLIALFLIFAFTVCTFQMCQKESYDIHVLYAGGHAYGRESVAGDYSEYVKARSNLEYFTADYDENGEKSVAFKDLFVPTDEELRALDDNTYYSRAYSDSQTLRSLIVSGDYFICIFSSSVYESFNSKSQDSTESRFDSLASLPLTNTSLEYYDDTCRAVYLASTKLYTLPGFSSLPKDTVICLKSTGFSTHLDKKANEQAYNRAKDTLVKILNSTAN